MTGHASAFAMPLLAGLLTSVLVSAGLLATHRPDAARSHLSGREADAAHLLMNGCMAWMLTPWYGARGQAVTGWLFAAMAVSFGVLLLLGTLRPATYWHRQRPVSGYHLCAAAAMGYATLIMPDTAEMPAMSMSMSMSSAHQMPAMPGAESPSGIAWVLAVIFALDALGTAIIVLVMPAAALVSVAGPGTSATGLAPEAGRRLRISGFPHVVMDLAMVAMLLGPPW
ncbi:MAG TPA: DUF5134 domain-containing protein [Pseudonocardia sp.]|jgi:hypothetical protein